MRLCLLVKYEVLKPWMVNRTSFWPLFFFIVLLGDFWEHWKVSQISVTTNPETWSHLTTRWWSNVLRVIIHPQMSKMMKVTVFDLLNVIGYIMQSKPNLVTWIELILLISWCQASFWPLVQILWSLYKVGPFYQHLSL